MAMTDTFAKNEDSGEEIFLTTGTWQVAYLLVSGYDFSDYYKNPENEAEIIFQFNDITEEFKKLIQGWHERIGEPGKFNNYREVYRKISKIIKDTYI